MKQQHALIGLGGVLALIYLTRPKGTVTTSESFDLSPYGGPTNYPDPIKQFAQAVARAEGFYVPGSIPARAHNPGDLKAGGATLPGTSITQYESDDAGWAALYRQLWAIVQSRSDYYDLGMSIEEMAAIYTGMDNQRAWAQTVAGYLGASTSTPLYQVLT